MAKRCDKELPIPVFFLKKNRAPPLSVSQALRQKTAYTFFKKKIFL
jgi:hypothetical protein